ncbi:hypothetical protein [uncultured Psychroserpens sp.]|uniref:hypothetical protein n=1 Tax=uncultured Psychroserpens sp. TaxID=255436 RepID=UPI00261320E6|nr:hypothetical protein [uncultured Psychroserpens sp.]
MTRVTFEVFHDDFDNGVSPYSTLVLEMNYIPRIGEKVYIPEAIEELKKLKFIEDRVFFSVTEIINYIKILPDDIAKNHVTCHLEVHSEKI